MSCERGFAVTKARRKSHSHRRLFSSEHVFILLLADFGNTTVQPDMGWCDKCRRSHQQEDSS